MQGPHPFTRREFLATTSCLGAAVLFARHFPLAALTEPILQDPRVGATPILDKGFALTRKIGEGVYATISDFSKGLQTVCNGGFLVGRDAALLLEGHREPAGAAYELEALRQVSPVPVRAAIDTHYHFDHTLGNAFYGAQGIPVWAHPLTGPLMIERYANLQGKDKAPLLAPYEKRVQEAATETERQRAQSDLGAFQLIFGTVDSSVVSLPNVPLDVTKLPLTVDLGGLMAVIETYPGHTPTDIIVRVPEQNIVFTGDLLFNGWYPASFDADMSGWLATLEKFAAFAKDTLFVPGHGQLCGQEGVAGERAVFEHLREHAEKCYRAGLPVEEAQRRYTVPEKFAGHMVFSWWFCIETAIAKFYDEFQKKA